ncbi:D-2-hydroxyacid dehydrogenase [Paenibacillus radicis (ex Xue et al. 2023)]|uniref:D-2-hydroxyacid dehydrogenase n=1 Tax=Paenibacillus radicis (ex Xue et al. 2023) TaxID=2972489 RepID=A0ABT1YNR3_9BACL|nr:D-2-hydroxyacid dehydrogenase [Paenibacillus radicis (ex Xue et al. 2023)]MCR8634822.1 D-2-hydroxyacid dehydrogenase [Paenibacillus radicis (ex Xue et al. 2023)]
MNKAMPNILVYYNEAEKFAEFLKEHGCTSVKTAKTPEEALLHLPGTEIVLSWNFPSHLLAQPEAASVQWVQSTGAGIDSLVSDRTIPQNVVLTRIVDQFGGMISEYVFAYLLLHCKDIPRLLSAQANREWDKFSPGSLEGKVIGVAGLGSIGVEIVKKARAFHMKVHGLSLSGKNADIVDRHFTAADWKTFVSELDYLILTLPLTNETRHVINRDILLSMKSNACLVNVGRGSLIVERDMLEVLKEQQHLTAVLDVFEKEPLDKENPLWSLPNVYITPHLSGPSKVDEVGRFFVDNLRRFVQGSSLQGVVDRERGY